MSKFWAADSSDSESEVEPDSDVEVKTKRTVFKTKNTFGDQSESGKSNDNDCN